MVQTIILFIAVFLFIYSIVSILVNTVKFIMNFKSRINFITEIIMITIGLTYILWYCN